MSRPRQAADRRHSLIEEHLVRSIGLIRLKNLRRSDPAPRQRRRGGVIDIAKGARRRQCRPFDKREKMTPATSTFAPFRLTICGIPELDEHCAAGVTHVLSIIGPDWPDPPSFAAFPPHHRLTLCFHDVIEPPPELLPPTAEDIDRPVAIGREP